VDGGGLMPTAPARACPRPGCPHRQPCPVHPPRLRWAANQGRSAAARGYGHAHRALRAIVFAQQNFLCAECRRRPCVELDHRVELRDGGTNARDNVRGLCLTCHAEKTRRERARRRTR
jgi:5-methylcytosine-specific restriction endonuclease McrA